MSSRRPMDQGGIDTWVSRGSEIVPPTARDAGLTLVELAGYPAAGEREAVKDVLEMLGLMSLATREAVELYRASQDPDVV